MKALFQTQEIGSLAKPAWRVKGLMGREVTDADIEEARTWGKRLSINNAEDLIAILRSPDSPQRRRAVLEWSAVYAVRLLEKAGLDIVFDGEQWRSEMYDHFMTRVAGILPLGNVRSFDNKYYMKGAATERIRYRRPIYVDEYLFAKKAAEKPVKVPFTGAYTLVDWSFNEYYLRRRAKSSLGLKDRKSGARRDFLMDMAKKVIRPEIRNLVKAGAEWIQIDEPAATTHPDEVNLFVESFNESVAGVDCKFSLHICYSDYSLLFPSILEIKNCQQFAWEYANRDKRELGTGGETRTGYETLKLFKEYSDPREIGLGVLDIHVDYVEPPELVRDRVIYASNLLGPERIYVNPDCGLRTRNWEVAFAKLINMVAGAHMARKAIAS